MNFELYLLGAGKPIMGRKPSALKNIASNTRAMDWQLHSFEDFCNPKNTFFLGGYNITDVSRAYPDLNFTIVPNWESSNALGTLLHAPFTGKPVVISYTDTLFRKSFVNKLLGTKSEVTFVVDSMWKKRYQSRSYDDISKAETLTLDNQEVEFTGLMYLGERAVTSIRESIGEEGGSKIGSHLLELISFFDMHNIAVTYVDVLGDWAEFNAPNDVANFVLGTKADTLARLEPIVKKSYIGPQESFTTKEWRNHSDRIISTIQARYGDTKLVVRSSSKAEDNWRSSNAGGFESILNVTCMNTHDLNKAIQDVITSYGDCVTDADQVLVQEFLLDVSIAGVVFTCTLESGAPYYRFNFDDISKSTESVTAGTHTNLRTVLVNKQQTQLVAQIAPELCGVVSAVQEIEQLLSFDKLDIEFAVDSDGNVNIFQVRPVVVNHENYELDINKINLSIKSDVSRYQELQRKLPHISGNKTIFANMPDWNPAEIISTRPKPLALSLYQKLITNEVWALQRSEYGYRDVRPSPLIISFSGQPYVDVRSSFNSFVPKSVSTEASERIVNAYLSILSENPNLHDKVEFDVAFTVWIPNFLKAARNRLKPYGVTEYDILELDEGLKQVTREAFTRLDTDVKSVEILTSRFNDVCASQLSKIDKVIALLDDCRRFGTLAFSHAARAGFVAKTMLDSLVKVEALTESRKMDFLRSFDTVMGQFEKDKANFSVGLTTKAQLVEKYGHLRPGTYEVKALAYWEDPEKYLLPRAHDVAQPLENNFKFNERELSAITDLLADLGAHITADEFVSFVIDATQKRESVKFEFTRNLSRALDLCVELAPQLDLSRDDVSFLTYSDLEQLKLNTLGSGHLKGLISARRDRYQLTKAIEYTSVIESSDQFYCFERHSSLPNFVGVDSVIADLTSVDEVKKDKLSGKIVMIPQADPGYDWLFGHDISGLITQYGGGNSHMAIRAAEIGLPAAIGVGDKLYDTLANAKTVELDCLGQILRVIE